MGGKVLVLTVDPARRLADALGLSGTGHREHRGRIPDDVFRAAGVTPRGELWAAMLDTKESWDALVRRHAPDDETREQILANPLYRNIAGRFVQSHDYIAMERLYEIHAEGSYDLIVVDTPPTRNALDFLDAPQRMADFFSSRLLRWLIVPYRSRLVNVASRPFYQVADRILGTQFLADIAEFFILFQSMYDGFVERAESVTRLLVRPADHLHGRLDPRGDADAGGRVLRPGARPAPAPPRGDRPQQGPARRTSATRRPPVAEAVRDRADELAVDAGRRTADRRPSMTRSRPAVLEEVADSFLNFGVVARREAEQQAELATSPEVLATVPFFDADIYDMAGLLPDSVAGSGTRRCSTTTSTSGRTPSGRRRLSSTRSPRTANGPRPPAWSRSP